jgi:hypothetical protein
VRYKSLSIVGVVIAWTWAIPGLLSDHPGARGADDPGDNPIRAAEQAYRDAIAHAREEMLISFERKLESARAGKRLKADERQALARRIEAERDAFRATGRPPASPRMKDDVEHYRRTLRRAEDLCRHQFEAVARVHRDAGEPTAETAAIESWERLFLETADLEAFPDRWVPLFDSHSLNGWFVERGDGDAWRVESGALVARGDPGSAKPGSLLTEREFRDFILSFEFQLAPDSDSGLVLRATRDEPAHLELNLRSVREAPSVHGFLLWSLSGNARDGLRPRSVERSNGPWNRAVIESRGDLLRVTINGRLAHSTDLRWFRDKPNAVPGVRRESGHIGFQADLGSARFRNIKIRGIPSTGKYAGTVRSPDPDDAVVPVPGRFYRVVNEETGKALDVLHSSLLGGSPGSLVQAALAERPSQAWMLRTKRGRSQIVNGNSNLLINVPLGRQEDGNGLIQWPDQNGAGNELWTLIPDGREFRIASTDGLVIIVNDLGRVEVRTPQGKSNELWRFVPFAL